MKSNNLINEEKKELLILLKHASTLGITSEQAKMIIISRRKRIKKERTI